MKKQTEVRPAVEWTFWRQQQAEVGLSEGVASLLGPVKHKDEAARFTFNVFIRFFGGGGGNNAYH